MPPAARPAATLILLRETAPAAPPDLLMVERSARMLFAAGAAVFPGGAVDAADHALAAQHAPADPDDLAARIAAIRETLEETGLAIGLTGPTAPEHHAAARADLAADPSLAALLAKRGWHLAPDLLIPYARWRPPFANGFDTRFYLARLPAHAPAPTPDHTENARAWWSPAAATLAAADTRLLFPTQCTLARLAPHASFAEAAADAARHPPTAALTPQIERIADADWLTVPPGHGYPPLRQPLATAQRR